MGTLVIIRGGQPVLTPRVRRGTALRVVGSLGREVSALCRLTLSEATPLSPFTRGFEALPHVPPARGVGRKSHEEVELTLRPGVWSVHVVDATRYLLVGPHDAQLIGRARAFAELGAVAALQRLGLDDAAVALTGGDYELACYQWIVDRETRGAG